ncbi:MAG: hypothetical protein ACTHQQ_07730 [Solirubrobacteraceae bacterium]
MNAHLVRCVMTIKRGAAIKGTVTMRITRGKVVFARGHGRIQHGKATLTMRLLRRMPPGRYTVTMKVKLTTTTVVRRRMGRLRMQNGNGQGQDG